MRADRNEEETSKAIPIARSHKCIESDEMYAVFIMVVDAFKRFLEVRRVRAKRCKNAKAGRQTYARAV